MPDERDVHVARLFEVLDDVDVPDVWEAIMARVDTEPTDLNHHVRRSRRWWPVLAAAALLIVAVSVRLADDSQTVDVPPPPAEQAPNTLEVTAIGADLDVQGSLVAGTVSIAGRNIGDGLHSMVIGRLIDGKTLEDARDALASAGPDVPDASAGILEVFEPSASARRLARPWCRLDAHRLGCRSRRVRARARPTRQRQPSDLVASRCAVVDDRRR